MNNNPNQTGSHSKMSVALPLLLSVGGAVAAGLWAEKKGKYISRAARSAREHAGDYYDTAYDAASHLAHDAQAKTMDWSDLLSKKLAEYAATGAAGVDRIAHHRAELSDAGARAARRARRRARRLADEGSSRAHDAYSVMRSGRGSVQDRSSGSGLVITGLTIAGIGAAAVYLFHPEQGRHRRRVLRESLIGHGQSAMSHMGDAYHSASTHASEMYHTAQKQGASAYKAAREQVGAVAETAKQQVSDVTDAARAAIKSEKPTDSK